MNSLPILKKLERKYPVLHRATDLTPSHTLNRYQPGRYCEGIIFYEYFTPYIQVAYNFRNNDRMGFQQCEEYIGKEVIAIERGAVYSTS